MTERFQQPPPREVTVVDRPPVRQKETSGSKEETRQPPMYNVWALNDNTTPHYFVEETLTKYFNLNSQTAKAVMLAAEFDGKGLVGTFPHDIAETKVAQANQYARQTKNPVFKKPMELAFTCEPSH